MYRLFQIEEFIMTIHSTKIDDETGVWFLDADLGGLTLVTRDGNNMWSRNVEDLVEFVKEKGLASSVSGSSTMDFASEEGFADDDGAVKMWDRVIECL